MEGARVARCVTLVAGNGLALVKIFDYFEKDTYSQYFLMLGLAASVIGLMGAWISLSHETAFLEKLSEFCVIFLLVGWAGLAFGLL